MPAVCAGMSVSVHVDSTQTSTVVDVNTVLVVAGCLWLLPASPCRKLYVCFPTAAQLEGQNAKLAEAAASADKLRRELAERDGVIAENYQTLQGLRRRVQELETHKFVLTYKVSWLTAPRAGGDVTHTASDSEW